MERIKEYLISFTLSLILFNVFSIYLYLRIGFYDLYIINKVFAGVAAIQLGIVLLLGPLSRMFNVFDKYLRYRNELGIAVFIFAMAHTISSLFFLEKHFPFTKYFTPVNVPFIFGLIGIIILTALFLISNQKSRDLLTVKKWWPIQYWGVRIAFITIVLHVFVMKYPGWVDWYLQGGTTSLKQPELPGLGLLVGWFMLFVLMIRLSEAINIQAGRIVFYLSIPLLILIYISTFIWGFQITVK